MSKINRRSFLKNGSGALGTLLLQGLASGIPPAYLLNPTQAMAQMMPLNYQTLILSTSSKGDPININCPGSYVNGVTNNPHLPNDRVRFGTRRVQAAKVWCDLPSDLRQRLAFVHYNPRTAAHPEYRLTMAMRGSVKNEAGNGSEMFASAMCQLAYTEGSYLQIEPIPLCDSFITFSGQPLQKINPIDLQALFSPVDQVLVDLRQSRDRVLDTLYADIKVSGNRSQRDFIDRYANSREQARQLGEQLGDLLTALPTNEEEPNNIEDQMIAAVALAQLKISPVMTVNIPFGQDNHQDSDLRQEESETISGVNTIAGLWEKLKVAGIQDQVTFATMNVFGRRSYPNTRGGRDHNKDHAVMATFGAQIQGGVYGGMTSEGKAKNIGSINVNTSMEAAGVSLARALGHSNQVVESRILHGQLIDGFLKT